VPLDGLPPGPDLPALVQTLAWVYRPIELMRRCQARYGDAFTLRGPMYPPTVFLSDPEAVREVFTGDPDTMQAGQANVFLRSLVGDHSLLLLDGPRHLRERKLLVPPFHGERMRGYTAAMRRITTEATARWPLGRTFALHARTQEITLEVILGVVFGIDAGRERDRLVAALRPVLGLGDHPTLLLLLGSGGRMRFGERWLAKIVGRVDDVLLDAIARRRAAGRGGDDVLSLLLTARDEEGAGLSDAELRDEMMTLLLAGHETTATALTFLFHRLGRHGAALERVREELEETAPGGELPYLDAAIRETLRLEPVAPVVGRKLSRDARVGRWELPAGTVVAPCIWLAQRRADLWPDPEAFRPERFLGAKPSPYEFFPFGGGARRCIGMAFALTEMREVAAEVLRRGRVEIARGYRGRVVRRGFTFALEKGLPVSWRPT
jgi:cytochrome P450